MTDRKDDKLQAGFPAGLSQPALRALNAAGYTRLEQLTKVKEADLLQLHGFGPKAIDILRRALKAGGQSFAGPDEKGKKLTTKEEVYDSPSGFVKDHIKEYVESNGEKGYLWRGVTTLLLTTRGRKTGKLRRTALIFGRDGKNHLIVASKGGAPKHPLWYLNLVDNPEAEIQVGAEKFKVRARTVTPEEKPRLWKIMADIFPRYNEYQANTEREIPLVILEPA